MALTTAQSEALIDTITHTIVAEFQPRRVILFGSHAHGAAGPDSDIDLFVEMESDRRPPERAIAISAAFGLHPWSMDVVVYTPSEVSQLRQVKDPFLTAIERTGKVLYERA